MNIRNLLIVLASLCSGIAASSFLDLPVFTAVIPACVAVFIFIYSVIRKKINRFFNSGKVNTITGALLFCAIGLFGYGLQRPETTGFSTGEYIFSGKVDNFVPTGAGDKIVLSLSSLSEITPTASRPVKIPCRNVKAMVTLSEVGKVNYGDIVSGEASMMPVRSKSNFLNDDYTRYLQTKGIYLSGYCKDGDMEVSSGSSSLMAYAAKLRYRLAAFIESTRLSDRTKFFIISVALGDKTAISASEKMNFSDAGVSHIFAISGLHVSMVGIFILAVISLFMPKKHRKWRFIPAIIIIWGYVILTGMTPATIRAGIMLTVGWAALALQRKNDPLKTLLWALLLILSFYPAALFDVGLQLSAVCVGSLITFVRPLNFINQRKHPRLYNLVSLLLVTLVATFSSWSICAFYFHKFSLMFLPANMIAVPLLPVFLVAVMIYLVVYASGADIYPLRVIIDQSYSYFRNFTEYLSSFSSTIDNLHPSLYSVLLWIVGLFVAAWVVRNIRKRIFYIIPGSAWALSILLLLFSNHQEQPDGFIIQKDYSQYLLTVYQEGRENEVALPPRSISRINHSGKAIALLDTDWEGKISAETLKLLDYVVLGKGFPAEKIEALVPLLAENTEIVVHPSVHWRREKKIIDECASILAGKVQIHSLRRDGPLHVFLPDSPS